ncbi:CBS domain-containing protein [Anaerorhabdus sp.]|nr:CBS domain-containing protein [Anaerorhabdus sp.]MEA4873967.1 CBS domain-containing protein [Anaerorhabdus sp.]
MDNAQRFLSTFAQIEKQLKLITGNSRYTKFYLMLEEAARRNKIVSRYEIELQEYSELRNAIVHQRDGEGKVIAQPTDETVETIEHIAELLCNHNPVSKFFLKHVITCQLEDKILDVQKIMNDYDFSKMPVYDKNNIVGIVTIEAIAKWACNELKNKTELTQVKDIVDDVNENEKIYFLSKNESAYDVIKIYTDSMKKGNKVLAILITEDGIKTQKPIGIVTLKDLPRILEYF